MDRNRTVTEIEATAQHAPEHASEPFSENGDEHGAVPASTAAPGLPPGTSGNAETPAAANATIAPVEVPAASRPCWCGAPAMVTDASRCSSDDTHRICKCGAGQNGSRCLRGHPYYGGELSKTHGLYVSQPSDADVAARADAVQAAGNPWWRFDWQREMFVEMGERLDDLLAAMRGKSRTLSVPNMKVGMQLLREWNALSAEMAEPALPRLTDSEHLARVGRVCVKHPQEFAGMLVEAMAIEPGVAEVLRGALDAHDGRPQPEAESAAPAVPTGKPPRARFKADDDDTVLL